MRDLLHDIKSGARDVPQVKQTNKHTWLFYLLDQSNCSMQWKKLVMRCNFSELLVNFGKPLAKYIVYIWLPHGTLHWFLCQSYIMSHYKCIYCPWCGLYTNSTNDMKSISCVWQRIMIGLHDTQVLTVNIPYIHSYHHQMYINGIIYSISIYALNYQNRYICKYL